MGLIFGDNISYKGKKPLDDRSLFATKEEMLNYPENYLPTLAITQCEEDGNIWVFNKNSTESIKWTKLEIPQTGSYTVKGLLQVLKDSGIICSNGVISLDDNKVVKMEETQNPDGTKTIGINMGGKPVITKTVDGNGDDIYTEIGDTVVGGKKTIVETTTTTDPDGNTVTIKKTTETSPNGTKVTEDTTKANPTTGWIDNTITIKTGGSGSGFGNGIVDVEITTTGTNPTTGETKPPKTLYDNEKDGGSIWLTEDDVDDMFDDIDNLW